MSWRSNQQKTGMNAQPLGAPRRWGGGGGSGEGGEGGGGGGGTSNDQPQPQSNNFQSSSGNGLPNPPSSLPQIPPSAQAALAAAQAIAGRMGLAGGVKRPAPSNSSNSNPTANAQANQANGNANGNNSGENDDAPRKRRSRWGDATDQVSVPTALPSNVSQVDLEKYAIQIRLDEISKKLNSGDYLPSDAHLRERSPSPPPQYDSKGHRTNTREVRYKKKLEEEKLHLLEKQMNLDPNFKPSNEYLNLKKNSKPTEKVFLPLKEFPEINFFGLLVGPRGNSLKKMERESGAKIAIRGKGSVKDGKNRAGEEDEEEMHCVVTGDDEAKVKKCVRLINLVIETAASTPEADNDHKRNQLRELASLNGTLRDDENQVCQNCGGKGHRRFECTEDRNWTAHIVCHKCGQQGHLARDCHSAPGGGPGGFSNGPRGGAGGPNGPPGAAAGGSRGEFDSEYASLMAELGENPAPSNPNPTSSVGGGNSTPNLGNHDRSRTESNNQIQVQIGPDGKKIPPWRDPNVWNHHGGGGGRGRGGMGMGMGMRGRGGHMDSGFGRGGGHHGGPGGFGGPPSQAPIDHGWGSRNPGPSNPNSGMGMGMGMGWGGNQAQAQSGYASAGYQQPQSMGGVQPGGFNSGYGNPQLPAAGSPVQAQGSPGGAAGGAKQDYSAEWAAYYAAQAAAGDPQAQQQAAIAAAAAAAAAAQATPTQPNPNSAEQKDYSKEWAEYYKSIGQAGY